MNVMNPRKRRSRGINWNLIGTIAVVFIMLCMLSYLVHSCSSSAPERAARQTEQYKWYLGQTATALAKGPEPTRTSLFSRPSQTPKPTGTPTPTITPYIVLDTKAVRQKGRKFVPFFKDPDDTLKYVPGETGTLYGSLENGLKIYIVEYYHGEQAALAVIRGWVEIKDLNLVLESIPASPTGMEGKLTCEDHVGSGHVEGKILCHAHFWENNMEAATLPLLNYKILRDERKGRLLFVELWPPVWFRCSDIKGGCTRP